MDKRRHKHVVNETDLEWGVRDDGRFGFRAKALGLEAGGDALGASLFELSPGQRAFPHHAHLNNEEAAYVLEGEGTLRIGTEEILLRAGDYVALPGREDLPHQIINSSSGPLRYLCLSTRKMPDVIVYPDSNKVFYGADSYPGSPESQRISAIVDRSTSLDYYQGEER